MLVQLLKMMLLTCCCMPLAIWTHPAVVLPEEASGDYDNDEYSNSNSNSNSNSSNNNSNSSQKETSIESDNDRQQLQEVEVHIDNEAEGLPEAECGSDGIAVTLFTEQNFDAFAYVEQVPRQKRRGGFTKRKIRSFLHILCKCQYF